MRDDKFEWDDRKAAANLPKHKISFRQARLAFDDPRAIVRPDFDEADEERFLLTGLLGVRMVTVVFTERGPRKRIISARKATKNEQSDYASQEI